jgi:hypothetical protein
MVVLMWRIVTEGGYRLGDEKAMRWCPCFNLYITEMVA